MALTEWHDLLTRLEHDPDSEILACMLIDELMESRGMNRSEADAHVLHARQQARAQIDIDFVADLIRQRGQAYQLLVVELRRHCAFFGHEAFTIFVIAGDAPPWVGPPEKKNNPDMVYQGFAVSLPATWARHWYDGIKSKLNRPARKNRRKKPLSRPSGHAEFIGW